MIPMTGLLINRTGNLLSQLGSRSENANKERKVVASPPPFHRNWPRVLSRVNDNYCVQCITRLKDCVCVPGQLGLNPSPVVAKDKTLTSKSETVFLHVNSCVANVHSVTMLPQKKGVNPNYCHNYTEIKYVKDVSRVGHLSSANILWRVYRLSCHLLDKKGGVVAMQWLLLMGMPFAYAAGTRRKGKILV